MSRLAIVMVLALCTAVFAQATKPTTVPSNLPQLLLDLGDDEAATRQSAATAIAAIGPVVLPQLQKAMDGSQDPEVRTTLQTLIADLERQDKSKPTLISLHVKEGSPKAAIEELSQQSGVPIDVWPEWVWRNIRTNVTIDADKQPFWVVMMDVCSQAGLTPQYMGGRSGNRVTLQGANHDKAVKPPMVFHDGYLFVLQSAQHSHTIDYGSSWGRVDSFAISIKALIDPKLFVLRGPDSLNVTEAVDEKGNSLKSDEKFEAENHVRASSWGATWMWDLNTQLKYVPNQGKLLKSFKAVASFVVAESQDTWELDVTKPLPATHAFPNGKYTVRSFTKQGDQCVIALDVDFSTKTVGARSGNDPYTDYNSIQSMIKVVDQEGKAYQNQGGGGGGGMGHASYTFTYAPRGSQDAGAPGAAAKIVWTIPTSIKNVEVPVEFNDLEIP